VQLLGDLVGPDPLVVFCGMAGSSPKPRDHYYETPGNSFWESLHLAGFTDRQLRPDEDHLLPSLGLGLTDIEHHLEPTPDGPRDRYRLDDLAARLRRWEPDWVAFTSKTVAHAAAREQGVRRPGLGPSELYVGGVQAFVLPGVSGANRRHDYDGRPTRIAWWRDLAALCGIDPEERPARP